MESLVASMIGYGHNYSDIAERLRIARETAAHHAKRAAKKIPGDLPQQMKIVFWFRGAPIELLTARWESPISGDVLGEV